MRDERDGVWCDSFLPGQKLRVRRTSWSVPRFVEMICSLIRFTGEYNGPWLGHPQCDALPEIHSNTGKGPVHLSEPFPLPQEFRYMVAVSSCTLGPGFEALYSNF